MAYELIVKECRWHGILAEDIPWLQTSFTKEKKKLNELYSPKKKTSTNVSYSSSCRTWASHYMQLPLIFGTAINKCFDAISQLSINHLATNKNNCSQMSKPRSISVPFVAITNYWCLYRLWQRAMTAKYISPHECKGMCQTNMYVC